MYWIFPNMPLQFFSSPPCFCQAGLYRWWELALGLWAEFSQWEAPSKGRRRKTRVFTTLGCSSAWACFEGVCIPVLKAAVSVQQLWVSQGSRNISLLLSFRLKLFPPPLCSLNPAHTFIVSTALFNYPSECAICFLPRPCPIDRLPDITLDCPRGRETVTVAPPPSHSSPGSRRPETEHLFWENSEFPFLCLPPR